MVSERGLTSPEDVRGKDALATPLKRILSRDVKPMSGQLLCRLNADGSARPLGFNVADRLPQPALHRFLNAHLILFLF